MPNHLGQRTEGDGDGNGEGEERKHKCFRVCADLGDELLAALVIGWQPHVWPVGLGEGEEDKSTTGGPTEQIRAKKKSHAYV